MSFRMIFIVTDCIIIFIWKCECVCTIESYAIAYLRALDNSLVDAIPWFAISFLLSFLFLAFFWSLYFPHRSSFIHIRPVDFPSSFTAYCTYTSSVWTSDGDTHTPRFFFWLSSSKLRTLHSLSFSTISIFYSCCLHFSFLFSLVISTDHFFFSSSFSGFLEPFFLMYVRYV